MSDMPTRPPPPHHMMIGTGCGSVGGTPDRLGQPPGADQVTEVAGAVAGDHGMLDGAGGRRTLQTAGATIPAAVVIDRYINPDFSLAAQDLWERAQSRPFTFERCCLCEEPWE
jgi:hypothetical protein